MSVLVVPRYRALLWVVGLSALGCDTFASRHDDPWSDGSGGVIEPPPMTKGGNPNAPTDSRPAISAAESPPPVSGGTLLATADGKGAVISDPDRDRISIVDLEKMVVTGTVQLEKGDGPGRLAEGTDGRIFAVLRGRGSVLTLDRATSTLIEGRDVCVAPRGIAYDSAGERLLVACAEGKLVELPQQGSPTRSVDLGGDLRDVVVTSNRITVSRFRTAELIELDSALGTVKNVALPVVQNTLSFNDFEPKDFEPSVAWRAVASNDGSIFVSHQRATSATVDIAAPSDGFSSPYGSAGGDPCGGIVQTGFTRVTSTGLVGTTPQLAGAVLPVDIAVASDRSWVAMAVAGPRDPNAPVSGLNLVSPEPAPDIGPSEPQPAVVVMDPGLAQGTPSTPCMPVSTGGSAPTTAVAANPVTNDLLVQVREPSQLIVIKNVLTGPTLSRINLRGDASIEEDTRLDTGHELFHRAAGAALACASCHPEGADDGRVWNFTVGGARRTQYLLAGLEGTQPFHWDGALADLGALMEDVMVGRMGGAHQTLERNDALGRWLFGMPREKAVGADATAAARGQELFDTTAGCASCHSGPQLTNNRSVDVGTGAVLQVPSLVGISRHAPYMHNGCAKTLADRFNPACGGKAHGITGNLTTDQISDLVAHLQTL